MNFIPNRHKKLYNNSKHTMNNGNTLIIIGKLSKKDPEHPDHLRNHYYCEFQTGYKGIICETTISNGTAYDPLYPSIYGVAYIGNGIHKRYEEDGKTFTREYKLWYSMLRRCFDEASLKKFPSYKNVTINERWYNYQNFCDDLPNLPNYNLWEEYGGSYYHLDKDFLSASKLGNRKEYGKDTCMFLSTHDNTSLGALTGKTFFQYNPEEKTYKTFESMTKFANDNGISFDVVSKAIRGERCSKGLFYGVIPENEQNILQFIEGKYKIYLENSSKIVYKWGLFNKKTKKIVLYKSLMHIVEENKGFSPYNVRDCAYNKIVFMYTDYHVFRLPEFYEELDLKKYVKNEIKELISLKKSIKDKPFMAVKDGEEIRVDNIRKFSEDYGVSVGNIRHVLTGGRQSTKGWKFYLI